MTVAESSARSDALFDRARRVLPGGNTRTTVFVAPHPPYAERGDGMWLTDVDGHRTIDALNNYTALIHGHRHPAVSAAAVDAIEHGASFGLPTAHEVEFGQLLAERVPAGERWRFANSGTEAVMMAIRVARAVTGRERVLRFAGAYHGSYDDVVGSPSPGVRNSVDRDVVVVPVGDGDAFAAAMASHGDEIAAVLFDAMPNRAGLRPADADLVRLIRSETERRGVLLIHDEVLTFRLAHGGLHAVYGFTPDLITLGKIIGGGFPVGAVGGRADVMAAFDPAAEQRVGHGGTFSGNPVTLRAGRAALEAFDAAAVDRLNGLGEQLRTRLLDQGWEATGRGSLVRIHVSDPADLWRRAYEEGVLLAVNGLLALSTAMDEGAVAAIADVFGGLRDEGAGGGNA